MGLQKSDKCFSGVFQRLLVHNGGALFGQSDPKTCSKHLIQQQAGSWAEASGKLPSSCSRKENRTFTPMVLCHRLAMERKIS